MTIQNSSRFSQLRDSFDWEQDCESVKSRNNGLLASVDAVVAHCKFKEELKYQTKLPLAERFEDVKGYCCLEAKECPYVKEVKKNYYCTHN